MAQNIAIVIQKWNQTAAYSHTKEELIKIRDGIGTSFVYRGSPEEKAEDALIYGLNPYRIDDVARRVASAYGINIRTFREYAVRASIERKSTILISSAPALIAYRWASNFKYGEVMSDFNTHARMLVEMYKFAKKMRISLEAAYDKLHDIAIEKAKTSKSGIRYSTESAADILGLPDLFPRTKSTGALMQLTVPSKKLQERHGHDAGEIISEIDTPVEWSPYPLLSWNSNYRDMRLTSEDIISMKIVVRGIPYQSTDVVSELVKTHLIDMKTGAILRKMNSAELAEYKESHKYGG